MRATFVTAETNKILSYKYSQAVSVFHCGRGSSEGR